MTATVITAGTTRTQAGATLLTEEVSRVDTSTSVTSGIGDGVILPGVGSGCPRYVLINNTANPIQLYANGSDTINGIGGAVGVPVLPHAVKWIAQASPGSWHMDPGVSSTLSVSGFGAKGDGTTDDTAAIQAAINAAASNGAGTVVLDALTYYIPGGLQLKQGVSILGQGATLTDDNNYLPLAGTWLKGNNTNPGIFWNNTPLAPGASQPTFATIMATAFRNVSIQNIGITQCTRGIYAGELGSPAIIEGGVVRNVVCTKCSQWSTYFENYIYLLFENVRGYNMPANAIGCHYFGVSCTNYNFGNCWHVQILAGTNFGSGASGVNTRNCTFLARAGAAHNDIVVGMMQGSNSGDGLIAIGGTSNSTSAVAVTRGQGVNLPLDMPVTFSTSSTLPTPSNGWYYFNTSGLQTFFVVPFMLTANLAAAATSATFASVAGETVWAGATGSYTIQFSDGTQRTATLTNGTATFSWIGGLPNAVWGAVQVFGTVAGSTSDYIQVGLQMRGAPVVTNNSTTGFVLRWGYPLIEIVGYGWQTDPYNALSSTNSQIQSCTIGGMDLEGNATNMLLLQNGGFTVTSANFISGSTGGQQVDYASRFCFRNAKGSFSGGAAITSPGLSIDLDSTSEMIASGVWLANTTTDPYRIIQNAIIGVYGDYSTTLGTLNLGQGVTGSLTTLQAMSLSASGFGVGHIDAAYPPAAIAEKTTALTSQLSATLLSGAYLNSNVYSFAGSGNVVSSPDTATMQTLDATAGGSVISVGGSSLAGFPFEFTNNSTNSVLLTSAAGQPWNNSAHLFNIKVLPNGTFFARAQYNGTGTNGIWSVLAGDHIPYYTFNANNLPICGGTPRWMHMATLTNANFTTAGLTQQLALFKLPIAGIIHAVRMNCTQVFTGGTIASYTLQIGNAGTANKYATAFNVFTATGYQDSFLPGSESMSAATSIFVTATSTVGNVNAATQGSCDVWVLVSAAA